MYLHLEVLKALTVSLLQAQQVDNCKLVDKCDDVVEVMNE